MAFDCRLLWTLEHVAPNSDGFTVDPRDTHSTVVTRWYGALRRRCNHLEGRVSPTESNDSYASYMSSRYLPTTTWHATNIFLANGQCNNRYHSTYYQ
jgi:hypothetical protein